MIAPLMLCHTLNTAPGMVAKGKAAKCITPIHLAMKSQIRCMLYVVAMGYPEPYLLAYKGTKNK